MKIIKAERDEAIKHLRRRLRPGSTVHCILTHVSRSGMQRSIRLVIARKQEIEVIDYYASRALGYRCDDKRGGLVVGGCGMDMGFHLVYNLGRVLWPKGTKRPHGTRNGEPDRDGGYALSSRWL